ncbi:DNA-processing protein DprA [Lapillicoccus jejuensis]|uniref:DNA protecting protein DprA n=1 Tax=Lapillicoccus jejuensis TaxID=402171 RepID=A0A542E3C2_9MICO|nr:DNA-processing protein DprA [Lapillicoccus jejuensis]TQJ09842.1 DNA protecting protein DprA [Lapillicoccus jejuensis]
MSATAAAPSAGVADDERWARAAFTRWSESDDERVRALVRDVGWVVAAELALAGDPLVPEVVRRRADRADVERDLQLADALGARLLCPGDPQWPVLLDDLAQPPVCLWVRGPLDLAEHAGEQPRSVSVVGARASTRYGEQQASDLAAGLAERGFAVVSGAAFGIDGAAHRGALAVGGATVAVLAGGVDRPYPVAHTRLISAIAESGAVLSEVAPGSAPTRPRFLLRNRVIAALGAGTLVVEAGLRSGSLHTAGVASRLNRPVGAVPGPVTSMASAGCHEAVRKGLAQLVTDVDEVAELVGGYGADLAPVKRAPSRPEDALDLLETQILSMVPVRRPADAPSIAVAAGVPLSAVLTGLPRMELLGLVRRSAGRWRRVPPDDDGAGTGS